MKIVIEKDAYYEKRSKIGKSMYNMLYTLSRPLIKHRWLYWLLNFTWGILTTLCGLLISLFMLCIGKKPEKWSSAWFFKILKSWGGMTMGTMFLRDSTSGMSINLHEFGHTFQNAILGPLFIFIVAIPSAIRYWYRKFSKKTQPAYDAIWFEGSATKIGEFAYFYDVFCDSIIKRKE